MKRFEIYRNIRKRAMIFGLPISLFALMMVSILASLLIVIFSFSFVVIIGVLVFNASLYVVLVKITNHPQILNFSKVFPSIISNKKSSNLQYEKD
ncbi:hypothetical protein M8845_18425 [Gelidibacter japonicus]|nr:hypothetical protein [Gelidibacter japonicus]MCL8009407.1 hypothetical protein [Gelidibacter japonicus]